MNGSMTRNISLLASIAAVLCQIVGLAMGLSNAISHAPGSMVEGGLIYGGWAAMFVGLCFYARAKGRSWLWALIALFPFLPFLGFLISVTILLFLPDKSKRVAELDAPPSSRPASCSPPSPETQTPDSLRTHLPGGWG